MYGLAPTVNPLLEQRNPAASMYQAYSRRLFTASGQHCMSSRHADYVQVSKDQ